MKPQREFPERSTISNDRVARVALLMADAVRSIGAEQIHILDVGCGSGAFLGAVLEQLGSESLNPGNWEVRAWDVSSREVSRAKRRGLKASVRDIACEQLPEEQIQRYDIILAVEVLEHIADTGKAIHNIHGLLKPGGFVVLTTPNLAAWYNRLLLLVGNQPHMTEVSFDPHRYGNRLFERLLGEAGGQAHMAGHLRVFTYRALREFLQNNGLEILRATGISHHGDWISRLMARCWPGGAGNVGIVARKV